jgi:hypothetical protein
LSRRIERSATSAARGIVGGSRRVDLTVSPKADGDKSNGEDYKDDETLHFPIPLSLATAPGIANASNPPSPGSHGILPASIQAPISPAIETERTTPGQRGSSDSDEESDSCDDKRHTITDNLKDSMIYHFQPQDSHSSEVSLVHCVTTECNE